MIAQAKAAGISIKNLKPGELLVFINKKANRIAVLAGIEEKDSYGAMGYYRSPHGSIDQMAIQYIPSAFNGGRLDMTAAIRKALEQRFGIGGIKHK